MKLFKQLPLFNFTILLIFALSVPKAIASLWNSGDLPSPEVASSYSLEPWDRPLGGNINPSYVPQEFHLVEIARENPKIVVDMKCTTYINRAGRRASAETTCLVARRVMDKLNGVQAELEQQGLGLKVFDAFRPLYVSKHLAAVAGCCTDLPYESMIHQFPQTHEAESIPGLLYQHLALLYENKWPRNFEVPFSNRGAMVAVTLINAQDKALTMPTEFDDRNEKAHPDYRNLSDDIIHNRELLKTIMLKHGFRQAGTWYEFYDSEADTYPQWLYTHYTTAHLLQKFIYQEVFLEISRVINQLIFAREHKAALMTNYTWDKPLQKLRLLDKIFYIPWKFHLVEVARKNRNIVVDMKYTTAQNCAGKPVSAETSCLVSRNVMNKLSKVQAELAQQDLSLKIFDGFRPLYIEYALLEHGKNYSTYPLNDFGLFRTHAEIIRAHPRIAPPRLVKLWKDLEIFGDNCDVSEKIDYLKKSFLCTPPLIPFSNKGALVAVTLVDTDGKELAMPTLFDDRSEYAHPCYQLLSQQVLAHRELLKKVMLKHGFKQADTWYEFYDDEVDQYPHLLYSSYTTALQLNEAQKKDHEAIDSLFYRLINPTPWHLMQKCFDEQDTHLDEALEQLVRYPLHPGEAYR